MGLSNPRSNWKKIIRHELKATKTDGKLTEFQAP
jgi:hypothetical protein